ncbi:DUF871 domain-containing protein [Beduini massiliensis]|uniref:DUF871 domain-containing protein n=1 Tax=Beduini massiliensis TaxID=1585974 RepID=UPI00059A9F87|nr:MupG family TIM beta-alpha barrel fold protein [Beduini massiliensis]
MKKIGISLYPAYSTEEENKRYLKKAAECNCSLLFLALLGVGEDRQSVIDRYHPITRYAKELGYEIICDVNPSVFKHFGVNASLFNGPLDLSFFKELEVDVLRLDLGMNDMEEAYLTRNKEGIAICLSGANVNNHIGAVLAAGGNRDKLMGCHNYYPHRYTGVALDFFQQGTAFWNQYNLRCQAFISSNVENAFGPWPVTEGLPTLEMHRDLPIDVQLKHYVLMGTISDVMIGNCFASDEELEALKNVNLEMIDFRVKLAEHAPVHQVERLKMNLSRRGDRNDYILRTLESRLAKGKVEPFNTVDIKRGDVIIDNELYGQYCGEVQIALKDMKNSGKTNVIGHIREEEIFLIDYIKSSQPFTFTFI